MINKKLKSSSLIKIILVISLLINILLINKKLDYEKKINADITHSIEDIEIDLVKTQEILNQIIDSGEINELQYIKIYGSLEDFESEYKGTLYRYYYELESTSKDFSQINANFDIVDYMFNFGRERQLSLLKVKSDDFISVDLTENELEQFKYIANKNNNFLKAFDNYIIDKNTGTIRNWAKVVEEIYEVGLNE